MFGDLLCFVFQERDDVRQCFRLVLNWQNHVGSETRRVASVDKKQKNETLSSDTKVFHYISLLPSHNSFVALHHHLAM